MKIILLGGAGIIGKVIARDLALSDDVAEIVIADLNEAGAQATVAGAAPGDSRFKAAAIDVTDRAALVIAPQGPLVEQLSGDPLERAVAEALRQQPTETLLRDLVEAIEAAGEDGRISALYLDLGGLSGGSLPKLQELGQAIAGFRASGKPVIAYGDYYDQRQYYLAAQADEIYLIRNWQWTNELLSLAYRHARKICFGDGIGLYFGSGYLATRPADRTEAWRQGVRHRLTALRSQAGRALGLSRAFPRVEFDLGYLALAGVLGGRPPMETSRDSPGRVFTTAPRRARIPPRCRRCNPMCTGPTTIGSTRCGSRTRAARREARRDG